MKKTLQVIQLAGRKVIVGIVGGTVLVAGVIMLVTPGPGLLAIAAGLAILATEYLWARGILNKVRERIAAEKAKLVAKRESAQR